MLLNGEVDDSKADLTMQTDARGLAYPLVLVAVDPRTSAIAMLHVVLPFALVLATRLVLWLGAGVVEAHVRLCGHVGSRRGGG